MKTAFKVVSFNWAWTLSETSFHTRQAIRRLVLNADVISPQINKHLVFRSEVSSKRISLVLCESEEKNKKVNEI